MNYVNSIINILVLVAVGYLIYIQGKHHKLLKEKLEFAERWEKLFNVSQLLEQVKSHKELVEIIAEQSKYAEIEKIKKRLETKAGSEQTRKYLLAFFVLSILTLKLDVYTRKKILELVEYFDKSLADDLRNELIKMVPEADKERMRTEVV
jgi:hypothetical protein